MVDDEVSNKRPQKRRNRKFGVNAPGSETVQFWVLEMDLESAKHVLIDTEIETFAPVRRPSKLEHRKSAKTTEWASSEERGSCVIGKYPS